MTRSSAIWANDAEANDFGDDKPPSSRAIPFDDTRDDNEEDFFDVETGCIVLMAPGFGDVT
eukprot:scaffold402342_cov31-Attheya_sp.AAC.1